ncbi:MAG: DUF3160 domain-containing protein [Chloroflexota bacterium]
MSKSHYRYIAAGAALLTLLPTFSFYGSTPASAADFAASAFKNVWTRTDKPVADGAVKRSFYWGPTPGESLMEKYAQGANGMRRVQYFDKSRMEINNPKADPANPFYVTNGLLTVELITGKMQVGDNEYEDRTPANIPLASDNDDPNAPTYASFGKVLDKAENRVGGALVQTIDRAGTVTTAVGVAATRQQTIAYYEPSTGHNIPQVFWDFLNQSGPVSQGGKTVTARLNDPWFYAAGLPISEPYWAKVKIAGQAGVDVYIQAFQRRVLTYVPSAAEGFQVQMGNIGAHYYDWRYKSDGVTALSFAKYNLEPSSVVPAVRPYQAARGLTNVANAKDFTLTVNAKALIEQNNFAATFPQGDQYKQFYQLYEDGRYDQKPVFVTTDSVLHVYHLIFDKLLRSTETSYLINDLKSMTTALQQATQAQYDSVKGTGAENAARRNLAYLTVASRLLDPNAAIPAAVQAEVATDLAQIDAHAGLMPVASMGIGGEEYIEDFSQYVPRGHYTRSEDLKKYFRAMMWYGRITFRLKSADETRSAILLSEALQTATNGNQAARQLWGRIYEPTSFFVGGSDDLTYLDYAPLIDKAFGPNTNAAAVADDARLANFQELAKSLAAPRINSMFVYIDEDKEKVTKGLRLMGQRFTLDEYVFGQLIWRNVGVEGNERWLPKALDVPAAFGSQEAYNILAAQGETKYPKYDAQLTKVRGEIGSLADSQWTENLYWSWLYTFRPLLAEKPANSGYPSFMTNQAWTRKNLNTVQGSWTELKHDTLLYAKQVMAEMGGGPPEQVKGYVEPEPEFYARIAALVGMTRDGLLSRGLLEKSDDPTVTSDYNNLNDLYNLALDLKHISEKELTNTALTSDEYDLIQYYGGRLEHITMSAADPQDANEPGNTDLNDQDAAVVADVATGGAGGDQALTEGTGRIMELYVVVPVDNKLVLARGGIYSQYEFIQPSNNRLTDEQWREQLNNNQIPPIGDWKTFIAK